MSYKLRFFIDNKKIINLDMIEINRIMYRKVMIYFRRGFCCRLL